jgi:hypothetical protein
MHEFNDHIPRRRGSSPAAVTPDHRIDVWGERRLRSIIETPEDLFSIPSVVRPTDPKK